MFALVPQSPAQEEVIVAGIKLTKTKVEEMCKLSNIRMPPVNREDRLGLYIHCEVTGEHVAGAQSCCDHLTQGDANTVGRCPTHPVTGIWIHAVKAMDPSCAD
jgi:hypothetical protein